MVEDFTKERLRARASFYNTESVKPNEFSSYWDLLDPKWKGKIAMFERVGSGFPGLTPIYYNPRLGPGFIKRLLGEMNVTVSRDRRQATDWLASASLLCASVAPTWSTRAKTECR
jgi:hypothetical protein